MQKFIDLGLNEQVLKGVEQLGFQSPTPIQEKVISYLLTEKRDVIALAQTGTGKTAAFGLPICQEVDAESNLIQALVLAPTRELCVQITKEIKNYGKFIKGLSVLAVYGGESIDKQLKQLDKGPQILVATPGRLVDFIRRRKVNLSNINWIVLDEADEMLNMGFKDDLEFILEGTPSHRRTLLFSATMSPEIRRVASNYMMDPVEIAAGQKNVGSENVSHYFYVTESSKRYQVLRRLADANPDIYGIVFCRTRKETRDVSEALVQDGYNADALYGDLSQAQRDAVMKKFREGNLNLLVATDVAARGLDVNNLSHVINYNLPDDIETYTHRSGRTGRANNTGISISIVNGGEKRRIGMIEKMIKKKFEQKPIPAAEDVLRKQLFSFIDKVEKTELDLGAIEPVMDELVKKLEWMDNKQLIAKFIAFQASRLINDYSNAPDLNVRSGTRDRRDDSDRGERGERGGRERRSGREGGREGGRDRRDGRDGGNKTPLQINMGLKHGFNPARLLGLINETVGHSSVEVGRIDIGRAGSVFEVGSKQADEIVRAFKKRFKDEDVVVETIRGGSSAASPMPERRGSRPRRSK